MEMKCCREEIELIVLSDEGYWSWGILSLGTEIMKKFVVSEIGCA